MPIHYQTDVCLSNVGAEFAGLNQRFPSTLNDPFDCQHSIDKTVSTDEYAYLIPEMHKFVTGWNFGQYPVSPDSPDYQVVFDGYATAFLALVNDFGVYSLSAKADHLLLWAHYAASHTGFAIRYDTSEAVNLSGLKLYRVSYGKHYPALHIRDIVREYSKSAKKLSLSKGTAWKYEEEWRLLSRESNALRPLPWRITGIIFGHRMAANERQAVRHALEGRADPQYFEARPSHVDYSVQIAPLA